MTVFQRTAPWVVPRRDRPLTGVEKAVYRRLPAVQRLARGGVYWSRELQLLAFTGKGKLRAVAEKAAAKHLADQVPDAELRAVLTPDYRMGCKRVLISNDYFPAVASANVTVVPSGVTEVRGSTIVAADGSEHEVDVLIFGTGFQVMDIPVAHALTGRGGETLAEHWQRQPVSAHRGATVAGFPNLFLLLGPNTALGHSSVVLMIEAQIAYVISALQAMDRHDAGSVEVRQSAQDAYNAQVQRQLATTVWSQGGCNAWYTDDTGHNFTLWPTHTFTFKKQTEHFDEQAYELRAARRDLANA